MTLTGRTALVTGGNRGLGLAMGRGLGRAGARVLVNGRDPDPGGAIVDVSSVVGGTLGHESDMGYAASRPGWRALLGGRAHAAGPV